VEQVDSEIKSLLTMHIKMVTNTETHHFNRDFSIQSIDVI